MMGRARLAAVAVLLAYLVAAPLWHGAFLQHFINNILVFALFAMSLDLLVGYTGLVSLGHAAFLGLGAYTTAVMMNAGWSSLYLVLPASILVSAAAAVIIGRLSIGTTGVHFIMITLALAQLVYFLALNSDWLGSTNGMVMFSRPSAAPLPLRLDDNDQFYYYALALVLGSYWVMRRLIRSPFGSVIQGIRSNEQRLISLGYHTHRFKLGIFVIAGAFGGLSGHLFVGLQSFIDPTSLAWQSSGQVLIMVMLGGMGTLFGPAIGAAVFIALEEVISSYTDHWMLPLGIFLILVVLFGRGGVVGLWRGLLRRIGGVAHLRGRSSLSGEAREAES